MAKRVLVVEDSVDLRILYSVVLRSEGIEALLPESANDALDSLRAGPPPDLILLDLGMPDLSGEDFMRILRQDPRWTAIPVLLVSGREESPNIIRDLHADGYLQKPVELQTLHREIERHLRH